ncbi:putative methyltransferase [Saccharothrix espanaensis DSM 44229]|uniref:Putative methyltransferase n=2 Tax=Saccharothrix espanaensis TaxID=103731 RepID=K0JWC6_SACES|nr:putative methyltransferase [Saccharothrix espanaensis DSM 44229]
MPVRQQDLPPGPAGVTITRTGGEREGVAMTHGFDKEYWERHWQQAGAADPGRAGGGPPNPHLVRETGDLVPGTALDAGCGEGAEAIWLAAHGWQVTAADISAEVLARAAARASASGAAERVRWVEADLGTWQPGTPFDLVTTHYAHPTIPQLDFYDRIADWVAPGGTLLIVGHLHTAHLHTGHLHTGHGHGADHRPPAEASATAETITARLDGAAWDVATAEECHRTAVTREGGEIPLHDVVVRATRRR